MRKTTGYFRDYKLKSFLSPLFKLSEAAFELIVPLVIADIIDRGIPSGDLDFIKKRTLLLLLFAVVGYLSAVCAQYFAATAAAGIAGDIRKDLFKKVENLSISQYEKIGSSGIVTSLTSDVNQIQSGINLFLRLLLRSPFIVAGAVIMAFTISPRMSLIFIAAVIILGFVVAFNMKTAVPLYRKTREGLDSLADLARNGIDGIRVIRGFNRTSDDYKDFKAESAALNLSQKIASRVSSYLNPLTFLIINLAICMLIYRGGINFSSGELTQGQVVALYNYMSQILVELIKLANLIITVSRAVACADRVEGFLDLPDDDPYGTLAPEDFSKGLEIEFDNVSFGYEGSSEDILSGVSFKALPGEKIGIIGKTGSGKSTIAGLAAGLYKPSSGNVIIDGRSIFDYSHEYIAENISLCLQKAVLYKESVLYNIALGRSHSDNSALDEAVSASCTDDIIYSLNGGIDTVIGEDITGLSGGQKQRIGIARSLIGRPSILILDDSTSALDAATEKKLLRNLSCLSFNPTILFISQKIRSVRNCDRIILMDDGKISAIGSHEYLKKTSKSYRELLKLQHEEEAS